MADLREARVLAERVALEIAWDQWGALGFTASRPSAQSNRSLIDPEALLLLTLYLQPADDRFDTAVAWWSRSFAALTSIHRLKRLLPMFPKPARTRLAASAAPAAARTDLRWNALAAPQANPRPDLAAVPRSRHGDDPSRRVRATLVLNPSALVLRGRLLFGVNPRSDVIIYLLSRGTQPTTVREIVATTRYARSSIHQILVQLEDARLVARTGARPFTFLLCAEAWREVFGRDVIRSDWTDRIGFRGGYLKKTAARMWLCWPQIFSMLTLVCEAGRSGAPHVAEDPRIRAVFRASFEYDRAFHGHRLVIPSYHGHDPRRLRMLHEAVESIAAWYHSQT